jgi:thymidylate kinase
MERLDIQRRVQEVYMKFVDNGKLKPINGNRNKTDVEKNILQIIVDFLENQKTS